MKDSKEQSAYGGKVEFSGLVLGFSSAALHYIGHKTVKDRQLHAKNLPLAKHNIEIIELLREKTVNNLTEEESQLVERILNDLKQKYVQAQKSVE